VRGPQNSPERASRTTTWRAPVFASCATMDPAPFRRLRASRLPPASNPPAAQRDGPALPPVSSASAYKRRRRTARRNFRPRGRGRRACARVANFHNTRPVSRDSA
jgi:hypothetical protein